MTNRPPTTRPFEEWTVEELAYLEETLNNAYADMEEFLRDEVPRMWRWYSETVEQVSDLLDRSGIPFRDNSSIRELGVQGLTPIDLIAKLAS